MALKHYSFQTKEELERTLEGLLKCGMYGHRTCLKLNAIFSEPKKAREIVSYACYPNGYNGKFEIKFPFDIKLDVNHIPCLRGGFEINPQLLDLVQNEQDHFAALINYDHYFCFFTLPSSPLEAVREHLSGKSEKSQFLLEFYQSYYHAALNCVDLEKLCAEYQQETEFGQITLTCNPRSENRAGMTSPSKYCYLSYDPKYIGVDDKISKILGLSKKWITFEIMREGKPGRYTLAHDGFTHYKKSKRNGP